jgi:hypothetical protein
MNRGFGLQKMGEIFVKITDAISQNPPHTVGYPSGFEDDGDFLTFV